MRAPSLYPASFFARLAALKIRILGSAAGGGFPQWNCNAPLFRAVREGRAGFLPRTQSSIAVSADGAYLYSLNAASGAIGIFQIQPDGHLINFGTLTGLHGGAGLNGIAAN